MTTSLPHVLLVCVKNGGKSQMAAGLLRHLAPGRAVVTSAGTHPGTALNPLSVDVLLEVGVDVRAERPTQLTDAMLRDADLVVVLGTEAHVPHVPGPRYVTWETDEPSERGIDGIERMRLVRDDIARHVRALAQEL